jgi:hypothetical protein
MPEADCLSVEVRAKVLRGSSLRPNSFLLVRDVLFRIVPFEVIAAR